eukprot:jgi/Bigna1/63940/fgenesh1_kg.63_\
MGEEEKVQVPPLPKSMITREMLDSMLQGGGRSKTCMEVGKEWYKATGALLASDARKNGVTYKSYYESKYPHLKDDYDQIDKDLPRSMPTSFSRKDLVSFLTPLHATKEEEKEKKILDVLGRILRAFVVRRPAIGYSQGMNSIALFLLAFMDEEKVVDIALHATLLISMRAGEGKGGYLPVLFCSPI